MTDLGADERLPAEAMAQVLGTPAGAGPGTRGPRSSRPAGRKAPIEPPVADWRGFHDALRRAALAATQSGAPLSLLMLEPAGPAMDRPPAATAHACLDVLAEAIVAEAGDGSALARYAGERLAVIMRETGLGDAVRRAERIGRSLCARGADARARPAIGVAQFRDDEALGHLIERAEDALDRARSDGALIAVAGHRAPSSITTRLSSTI